MRTTTSAPQAKRPFIKKATAKQAKATKAKVASKATKETKATKKSPATASEWLGKKVKNFSLQNAAGEKWSLADAGDKMVVLYFYPKDSTPGCTIEGQDFSRLLPQFKKSNAIVVGVSRDSVKSHENFCRKYDFKMDLLSDADEELSQWFDVIKDKNMYGKKVRGIERSTFVIDENRKIVGEWRKVKVDGHAQEVLDFVKAL